MTFIADILLVAGALGAGFYCFILSRRLQRFNDLEKGVGGAVAVLSAQVDDLRKTLGAAQESSKAANVDLHELVNKAEEVAGRLELMMASMHDIPDAQQTPPPDLSEDAQTENREVPANVDQAGLIFMRHDRGVQEAGQ